ncbi:MAG: HAMP domain-containing protein [Treponema sp.]|nr:HAMP domain-containing protein [Candidatus Treponema equifaecale]
MEAKVSFPLSAKLVFIFSFLTTILFAAAFFLASYFIQKSTIARGMAQNEALNIRTATAVQNEFSKQQEEATNLVNSANYLSLFSSETFEAEFYSFLENYFSLNGTVYFIYSDTIGIRINETNLRKAQETENYFSKWASTSADGIYNISEKIGQPALAIVFTSKKDYSTQKTAVAFSSRNLISLLSSGTVSNSMIWDTAGNLLAASSSLKTHSNSKFSGYSFGEQILSSPERFTNFIGHNEENDAKRLYSAQIFSNRFIVVTFTELNKILSSVAKAQILIIILYFAVMCLGVLLTKKTARKFVNPLEQLTEAMRFISAGKFNIELPVKSNDETAVLTESFNKMALSLEDFKGTNTISERKFITRHKLFGATVMQIKLENFYLLPECGEEKSKEFLDKYFSQITAAVQKGKGRILLQNQSTITCGWLDSDFEGSAQNAAWNAVKTTFMLRYQLFVMNKNRRNELKDNLRFNIGLSSGIIKLTNSEISENKNAIFEGQPMLFADCAADLNKTERTDIILEKSTFDFVKDRLIAQQVEEEKTQFADQKYYIAINVAGMKGPQNLKQLVKVL